MRSSTKECQPRVGDRSSLCWSSRIFCKAKQRHFGPACFHERLHQKHSAHHTKRTHIILAFGNSWAQFACVCTVVFSIPPTVFFCCSADPPFKPSGPLSKCTVLAIHKLCILYVQISMHQNWEPRKLTILMPSNDNYAKVWKCRDSQVFDTHLKYFAIALTSQTLLKSGAW